MRTLPSYPFTVKHLGQMCGRAEARGIHQRLGDFDAILELELGCASHPAGQLAHLPRGRHPGHGAFYCDLSPAVTGSGVRDLVSNGPVDLSSGPVTVQPGAFRVLDISLQ